MKFVFLFAAIFAEVFATSALKTSDGFSRPVWAAAALIAYAVAFFFLSLALKSMPTGVAYAIWSGVGIVLISLISWWAFDQKLDLPAAFGMGLIIAGVIVMMAFSDLEIK